MCPGRAGVQCSVLKVWEDTLKNGGEEAMMVLDSSMVEHTAVNRGVVGSSPTQGVKCRKKERPAGVRLRGQAVKTSPFHGGNTGSIPVGVSHINLAPSPSGKAKVCNTFITSSNLVGAF